MDSRREITETLRTRRLDANLHRGSALIGAAVLALISTSLSAALLGGEWTAGLALLVLAAAWALLLPWLITVLHSGPHLSLDDRGLRTVLIGDIPWADVAGLHLRTDRDTGEDGVRIRHYLDLCLRHPHRYSASLWIRKQTKAHADYGSYTLPLDLFDSDPLQIHRLALLLRRAEPAPFFADWQLDVTMAEVAREIEALRERAGALGAAQASAEPTDDYPHRLRAQQASAEREVQAEAQRRERELRRSRTRREAERTRQRRDSWLIVGFVLAALLAAYLLDL
ncbi:hypothetical protein LVB77_20080 [Lysobacter sp. 5GHs7-4]|uniref:hypothetical protein n=1 Tax=Lysobacter sp. 5GHs7-4 TaxID=2904253 RepID=UPI001E4B883C|nr:hypothetical protein [Lysobacter sp. 5GHs7-4]UHQ22919.1 hypothetical protein LVB77_20080 [Lysobacter sp. 5GHs7-4]